MDGVIFAKVLIKNLAVLWTFFALIVILAVHSDKSYIKSRKGKGKTKELKNDANILALFAIIMFGYCLYVTIPTVEDICKNDYISVHGEFHAYNRQYDTSAGITTDNKEHISLKIPFGHGGKIPRGECEATIWYAENSHYVVAFIPDEDIDDSD